MVTFKTSVRFKRLTPGLMRIVTVLYQIDDEAARGAAALAWLPDDLVVTSVNDSKHSTNSPHYRDVALDLRSHNVPEHRREDLRLQLAARLGPQFTVLLEDLGTPNEHFHLQVKKGTTYP